MSVPKKLSTHALSPPFAFAAHAGGDAVSGEHLLVVRGGIWAAAIGVVQQPHAGVSVRERHEEGLLGQLPGQPLAHRPSTHEA